jgi:parallel beta-helix repeat protein
VNGKPIRYYRNQSGITVPSGAGEVILANCTNMVIENQNLSDALGGIEIGFSSNITIMNNTFLNNTLLFGIDIYYSTFTLLGNNTSSDYYGGIHLTSSSNNSLSNNNCRIVLSSSSNNIISNNTCSKYGGILLEYCSNSNTLTNNNCSNNYRYGICISQSSGNTLSNNNCSSNSEDGMYLYLSSFNTISNNTFSLNPMHGINSDGSNGNVIQMNLFLSNGVRGMILWASTQNEIWNNTFIGNNGAGGTYDPSHIQARDDCSGNWWNSTDGYGNYWSDWTTPDAIPPWGVVDHPYLLDGSAGAEDYYPLTTTPSEPIPEFGMMPFVVMVLLATTVLTMRAWRRKAQ